MKPKAETWTIVVAGAWNVGIFSPDWVTKHLIPEKPLTIEVALAAPIQLKFNGASVVLIAADDRLIAGAQEATMDSMSRAEEVVVKALELLPHTPTTAVGVNFGFEADALPASLVDLFRLRDLDKLGEFGCRVTQSSIVRRLEVEDMVLNVTHSYRDGLAQLHLNFHQDRPGEVPPSALRGKARKSFELAKRFMSSVYGVTIEEEPNGSENR